MLGSSVVSFILFIKFGIMLEGKVCLMANLHFFPMLLLFFIVKGTLASDTSLSKVVYPVIYSILLEVRRTERLSNFAFPHSCILIFFFVVLCAGGSSDTFYLEWLIVDLQTEATDFHSTPRGEQSLPAKYPRFTGRRQGAEMGPELWQGLCRSPSVPSRECGEERRTCPRNSSSKVLNHPRAPSSLHCTQPPRSR